MVWRGRSEVTLSLQRPRGSAKRSQVSVEVFAGQLGSTRLDAGQRGCLLYVQFEARGSGVLRSRVGACCVQFEFSVNVVESSH